MMWSVITPSPAALVRGDAELVDDPIDPACVLAGQPRARGLVWAESADGTSSNWVWDCTAGTFRWWFGFDETVSIVKGSVTVQVDGDEPVVLTAGDAAYWPAGRWSTWTIDAYVRKHAVLRLPVPRPMATVVKGVGRRRYAAK